jgi:aminoglycoside phosphotransferase (APT) family kinase protein
MAAAPRPSLARMPTESVHALVTTCLQERVPGAADATLTARRPSPFRSSFAIEEIDLRLADGRSLALMVKDLSRSALSPAARRAKRRALYDPLREVGVYRNLLRTEMHGTAAYLGSIVDPSAGRYWLILERVAGKPLTALGTFGLWVEAARRIAMLHHAFADRVRSNGLPALPLVRYDAAYFRAMYARLRRLRDETGSPGVDHLTRIARCYGAILPTLASLPLTFIHGECFPSNILVVEHPESPRICLIDWEMAGVGSGLLDLAALAAGWPEDHQDALARAYAGEQRDASAVTPGALSFAARFDCCQLHVAVQELTRARNWKPPPEHARDWSHDALVIVERLAEAFPNRAARSS